MGVEKLIGTRIVLSGYVTFATATTAVVDLPQNLPGNWNSTFDGSVDANNLPTSDDYLVFISAFNDTSNRYSVTAMATTSTVQNFTITCSTTVSSTVFWMIVRKSNASVTGYPTHN